MADPEERPDAAGVRPLKAVVHGDRVYLDLTSLTHGYRSRADALEARGYTDVAALYRREADELDTAAIEWLSSDEPPRLPPPRELVARVSMLTAQLIGEDLRENRDVRIPALTREGNLVQIQLHVLRNPGI